MDARTEELAERLVEEGKFPHMSASEGHELHDGIRKLETDRKALLDALKERVKNCECKPSGFDCYECQDNEEIIALAEEEN